MGHHPGSAFINPAADGCNRPFRGGVVRSLSPPRRRIRARRKSLIYLPFRRDPPPTSSQPDECTIPTSSRPHPARSRPNPNPSRVAPPPLISPFAPSAAAAPAFYDPEAIRARRRCAWCWPKWAPPGAPDRRAPPPARRRPTSSSPWSGGPAGGSAVPNGLEHRLGPPPVVVPRLGLVRLALRVQAVHEHEAPVGPAPANSASQPA